MTAERFAGALPLVLVGAGKMGGAMLAGWLDGGLDPKGVAVIDPSPPPEMTALVAARGLTHHTVAPAGPPAAILVVAVKPQVLDAVLAGLTGLVGPGTTIVSVAAGKPIAAFERAFGPSAVVRAMPNTPAQVGRGITGCHANDRVGPAARATVEALLRAVGDVVFVDDEAAIDAVTAVSGSGPAYVFHMVEALTAAARALGLPAEVAARLARATVEGAGELLHRSDLDPATLRKNVTSPGGTTAAALEVLMPELPGLMTRAVAAADRRAKELAG